MTDGLPARRVPACFSGERTVIDPAWVGTLGEFGIAAGSRWSEVDAGELISSSATAGCFRIELQGADLLFFKRQTLSGWKRLRYWLRPSRNLVEAYAYARLAEIGLPGPRVLGYGEARRCGALDSAFIVTLGVPGAMDLRRFLHDVWARAPAVQRQQLKQEISTKLVQQLRRAHAAGFYHQDLKWRNVLVAGCPGQLQICWIDAPHAKLKPWRRRRAQIVDLSGLARVAVFVTSPYERMRFLRGYLGPDASPGMAGRLYRAVAAHLARRPPVTIDLPLAEPVDETD